MGCGSSQDVSQGQQQTKAGTKRSFTSQTISAEIFVTLKEGNITDTYEVKSTLGEGSFGCVKLVVNKKSRVMRAMKQILKSNLIKEDQQTLFSEMEILRSLDHPNIVKLHELYQDRLYYYLITDFCEGGELFDRLTQESSFTEKKAASIMKQILSAVVYCHDNDIVHRDLKLENVLFESKSAESNLKVIDFGTSRKIKNNQKLQLRVGTLYYMAPEVFKGQYDLKCDVWSAGVILYILLCGYPPFNGDDRQIRQKIERGQFLFPDQEWLHISEDCKQLIRQMLTLDPSQRITAREALQNQWIQSRAPNQPVSGSALKNLNQFYCNSKLRNAIELFIVTQVTTHMEREELQKQFKAIDANQDGTLSREELLNCYKKLHQEKVADEMVSEIMKEVDTNNSGKIDFTEFLVAAANKEKMHSEQKLKQVFLMFDKNGDGKIQRAELQHIMSGLVIDDAGWQEILDECDKDKDGEISLEELIGLMRKLN